MCKLQKSIQSDNCNKVNIMQNIISIGLLVLLAGVFNVNAQSQLNCQFFDDGAYGYTCLVNRQNVTSFTNVTITGNHTNNRNNSQVMFLEIATSSIALIVNQLFQTFPNALVMYVLNSGLSVIQLDAFMGAGSLRVLEIEGNDLRALNSNSFNHLERLEILTLRNNKIMDLNGNVFQGLGQLNFLSLNNNTLRSLQDDIFSPLTSLEYLFADTIEVDRIGGRLFENNRSLRVLDLPNNNITAIESNFIDNLRNLTILNLIGNHCTDSFYSITNSSILDQIRSDLSQCFTNFAPRLNVTRLILEVEGHLTLFNENGTVIVRV